MKKALSLILALVLALSLAACGGSGNPAGAGDPAADPDPGVSDTQEPGPGDTNTPSAPSGGGSGSGPLGSGPVITDIPTLAPGGSDTPESKPADADKPSGSQGASGSQESKPADTDKPSGNQSGSGAQESKPAGTNTPSGGQSGSGAASSKPADTDKPSDNQSGSDTQKPSGGSGVASAVALLTQVWSRYSDSDKFPTVGGGPEGDDMTENAPGVFDIGDADVLDSRLVFPAASAGKIDSAASLMHMMNANTFTCGAFHAANAGDVAGLCAAIRDNVKQRQWMCGFPEKLVIVTVDDYIVSFFGSGGLTETFKTQLTAAYPAAEVYCDEPVM